MDNAIAPSAAPLSGPPRRKFKKKDAAGAGGHTGRHIAKPHGKPAFRKTSVNKPRRKSTLRPNTSPQRRGTRQLQPNKRVEKFNKVLALGSARLITLVLVILALVGTITTLAIVLRDDSVCSYVAQDPDADPLDVQICDILACPFDVSLCDLPCPFGYSEGEDFCPETCLCAAEGSNFEGDIQFIEEDLPRLFTIYGLYMDKNDEISLFRTSAENTLLWDQHKEGEKIKVPYTFDYDYSAGFQNLLKTGQQLLSSKTCLDFVPRTTQKYFIKFSNQYSSCSSYIGRSPPGHSTAKDGQRIKFKEGRCREAGSASHEIMHALGFVHEHARPDRDEYVKIIMGNIKAGRENNFRKMQSRAAAPDIETIYDYGSIMHYSGTAFAISRSKSTILRVDNGARTIRQRERVTEADALGINLLYKCPQTSFLRTTTTTTTTTTPLFTAPTTIGTPTPPPFDAVAPTPPAVIGPDLLKPTLAPIYEIHWGPWGVYLGCTIGLLPSCWLGGIGLRERLCVYGTLNECLSKFQTQPQNIEIIECTFVPCEQVWRPWGQWQPCSRSCGGGSALRFRESATNTICSLDYTQAKNCNEEKCKGTPVWSAWSTLSSCSVSCGSGGRRVLRRFCILPSGDHIFESDAVCPGDYLKPDVCDLKPCKFAPNDEQADETVVHTAGTPIFHSSPVDLSVGQSVCASLTDAEYAFGDVNGDKVDDVICGEYGAVYEIGIFGESGTVREVLWERGWRYCLGGLKIFADWNSDGKEDLLCQDKISRRLMFSINQGGRFPENSVFEDSRGANDNDIVFTLDADGDGSYDYVSYDEGGTDDYFLSSLRAAYPSL